MRVIDRARRWARALKRDVVAVYFAARDPATRWWLRIFALLVAAYALSPIDLIPDFIPVLGYVDDLIIVPLGLAAVIHLLPPAILQSARGRADALLERPRSWVAASLFVAVWMTVAAVIIERLVAWLRR